LQYHNLMRRFPKTASAGFALRPAGDSATKQAPREAENIMQFIVFIANFS
jgi:hypothetical protein